MRFAHKIFHLADIDNMQSNKQEKHNVYCINLYFRLLLLLAYYAICLCARNGFRRGFSLRRKIYKFQSPPVRR